MAPFVHADGPVVYDRDVAPILRTYCAGCHNQVDLESHLSVETYASLRKGGEDEGDPIKPGDPAGSFLIRSLEGRASPKMPPKDEPRVPTAELALLTRWIAEGAHGPVRDDSILQSLTVPRIPNRPGKPRPVTAAAYSPDGRTLAIARFGSLELEDTVGADGRHAIGSPPGKVNALHFSSDGDRLVSASGITGLSGVAQIWNVRDGQLVREFGGHRDVLYDAEFSPDGTLLATAGYDRVVRIWRVADGVLLRSMDGHKGAVFDLAFHPSGTVLASASADETVKLWRVSDGTRLDTLNQPQGEQQAVAFTPDGNHVIAAGSDRRIHLWRLVSRDAPALNPMLEARFAHESPIVALAVCPDGAHLVTTAADRTLKVWSLPDLAERHAYPVQTDVATVVTPRPGTNVFLVARMDGSVQSYSLLSDSSETRPSGASPPAQPVTKGSPPDLERIAEVEPNETVPQAQGLSLPAEIQGSISRNNDSDLFRFRAAAGEELTLSVSAARSGSRLDSRIEVLAADGAPLEQVVLQAVRDSWFTFRGKDSETTDDFRLHNWAEMELDEYLYANGEVVRLWLYPRGPDSGYKVYPGTGRRHTAFSTTGLAHPLGEPCYIVNALPAGSKPAPNGLPVFRLSWVNDDDPDRRGGSDSVLLFTAPADGEYIARLTDVRGFGDAFDYHYNLSIRERRPDFSVSMEGTNPRISPGSGREVVFKAERIEGFEGPIRIDLEGLPQGISSTPAVLIEEGQYSAIGVVYAAPGAASPDAVADKAVRVTASATIQGHTVTRELGGLGDIQIGDPPKVTVEILPGDDPSVVAVSPGRPLEFTIHPGQTIAAKVRASRVDFKERIEFGGEDSGRNFPHGVFIANTGLNGLLIVEEQTERDFVITAAPIARPGTRSFHLRTTADGNQCSPFALLHVLPPAGPGDRDQAAR